MASVDKTKVLQGRLMNLTINSSVPAEVFAVDNLKEGTILVNEAVERARTETESPGSVVDEGIRTRNLNVEITISEIDTTDIAAINSGGYEIVADTATGGANGTGHTLTIAAMDTVYAHIQDLKTKIMGEKQTLGNTLGYALADNSA